MPVATALRGNCSALRTLTRCGSTSRCRSGRPPTFTGPDGRAAPAAISGQGLYGNINRGGCRARRKINRPVAARARHGSASRGDVRCDACLWRAGRGVLGHRDSRREADRGAGPRCRGGRRIGHRPIAQRQGRAGDVNEESIDASGHRQSPCVPGIDPLRAGRAARAPRFPPHSRTRSGFRW